MYIKYNYELNVKLKGGKLMKKLLSLILAILMVFSVVTVAFAADSTQIAFPEDEAEAKAMMYIEYKYCTPIIDRNELYSDDSVSDKEVYKITLLTTLEDNTVITYIAYIDKYDGTVYNRTANYALPIASKRNPLSADEAFNYTLKALCAEKDNVIVLKKNEIKENGKVVAYNYEFVEDFYIKHKCTIDVETGFIDNISIAEPVNIIDRIILMIKVLLAKLLGGITF